MEAITPAPEVTSTPIQGVVFQVGDVVRLRSGSAPLTVHYVSNTVDKLCYMYWDAEKREVRSNYNYYEFSLFELIQSRADAITELPSRFLPEPFQLMLMKAAQKFAVDAADFIVQYGKLYDYLWGLYRTGRNVGKESLYTGYLKHAHSRGDFIPNPSQAVRLQIMETCLHFAKDAGEFMLLYPETLRTAIIEDFEAYKTGGRPRWQSPKSESG
ncbi:hypothetical protein GCM10028805_52400 [Spirosoma harenae]